MRALVRLVRLAPLMLALAFVAAACTKVNPNYCADAGKANGYACSALLDAAVDERDADAAAEATDVRDALEGGEMRGEVGREVAAEVAPTCTSATCSTAAEPICDVDAGTCRTCNVDSECKDKSATTPACDDGQCFPCKTDAHCVADATKPICAAHACRPCASGAECVSRGAATPACASSGTCVECVTNPDCATPTKPICNTGANTCRACQTDAECPANPGVCMADGHCATTGEVIFVDESASDCGSATGSSTNPYCVLTTGVSVLTASRHVLVIRGAVGEKLSLSTSAISPVIIGRKDSTGNVGSIPAVNATAIAVTSDTVLIRDLTVNAGTTASSKGILVTGTSTKVSLLRVTAVLSTGLGVDAEGGATLSMDECYVQTNSVGGLLVNGAAYNIANSVFAGNGFGVQFTASAISPSSQFWFNTVVGNGAAVSCDPGSPQTLSDSIVAGTNISCVLADSLTIAPTFSATNPYHLTAHLACPTAPAMFPDHDIDGDPRATPLDCGADQF